MNLNAAFALLELDRAQCTMSALKKAYAQQAKKHRPEQDPEGFTQVRLAYETIKAWLETDEQADQTERVYKANPAPHNTPLNTTRSDYEAGVDGVTTEPAPQTEDELLQAQHLKDLQTLYQTWSDCCDSLQASQHLSESAAVQINAIDTVLQEPGMHHMLVRQDMAMIIAEYCLQDLVDVPLEVLEYLTNQFDYESFQIQDDVWTVHDQLQARIYKLSDWQEFKTNSTQNGTPEHALSHPSSLLPFYWNWIVKVNKLQSIQEKLIWVETHYSQHLQTLHAHAVRRVKLAPSLYMQILALSFGFFSGFASLDALGLGTETLWNEVLSTIVFLLAVGITFPCALGILIFGKQTIRKALIAFDSHLSATEDDDGEPLPAHWLQRCYSVIKRSAFWSALDTFLIISCLVLWPCSFNDSKVFEAIGLDEAYTVLFIITAVVSTIHLRLLSRCQKVKPNHVYVCAMSLFTVGKLSDIDLGISAWSVLMLIGLMVRSQMPHFISSQAQQQRSYLELFTKYVIPERTVVTTLTGFTIALVAAMAYTDIGTTSVFLSIVCLVLYLWFSINAVMLTPPMTVRQLCITLVIGAVCLTAQLDVKPNSSWQWGLGVIMLLSCAWYWVYAYVFDHFDRWKDGTA